MEFLTLLAAGGGIAAVCSTIRFVLALRAYERLVRSGYGAAAQGLAHLTSRPVVHLPLGGRPPPGGPAGTGPPAVAARGDAPSGDT